jgi:Domain of unknown function (DUF6602)
VANPLYAADLRVRIEAALASAEHAVAIDHPGLVGTIREILVRELLRPILPPNVSIGTGKIVDHVGTASAEVDIVLYDRSLMPPLLYGQSGDLGVFPVEACIYAIQVKSTSTAGNLDQVIEQGRSLGDLTYLREACGPNGHPINRVMPLYFAFKSDLGNPTADQDDAPEITRWVGRHNPADFQFEDVRDDDAWIALPFPPIRILCVVGQGYGFYNGRHYSTYKSDGAAGEVVALITGIANTLLGFGTRRLSLPFGYYLAGPPQAEADPSRETPVDDDTILLRLARERRHFDVNDATKAILDPRLRFRGPSSVLGNVTEVLEALERLQAHGNIRRVNPDSTGPWEFEYVEPIE